MPSRFLPHNKKKVLRKGQFFHQEQEAKKHHDLHHEELQATAVPCGSFQCGLSDHAVNLIQTCIGHIWTAFPQSSGWKKQGPVQQRVRKGKVSQKVYLTNQEKSEKIRTGKNQENENVQKFSGRDPKMFYTRQRIFT